MNPVAAPIKDDLQVISLPVIKEKPKPARIIGKLIISGIIPFFMSVKKTTRQPEVKIRYLINRIENSLSIII